MDKDWVTDDWVTDASIIVISRVAGWHGQPNLILNG